MTRLVSFRDPAAAPLEAPAAPSTGARARRRDRLTLRARWHCITLHRPLWRRPWGVLATDLWYLIRGTRP